MEKTSLPVNPGPIACAIKHGFDATDHLFLSRMTPYDRGIIDDLRQAFYEHYDPQTLVEQMLVDKIAIHQYRIFRFFRLETHTIDYCMNTNPRDMITNPHLDRLSRYDARLYNHLERLELALKAARRSRELTHQLSQDENLNS